MKLFHRNPPLLNANAHFKNPLFSKKLLKTSTISKHAFCQNPTFFKWNSSKCHCVQRHLAAFVHEKSKTRITEKKRETYTECGYRKKGKKINYLIKITRKRNTEFQLNHIANKFCHTPLCQNSLVGLYFFDVRNKWKLFFKVPFFVVLPSPCTCGNWFGCPGIGLRPQR